MKAKLMHDYQIDVAPNTIASIDWHAVLRTCGVMGIAARNIMNGIIIIIIHDDPRVMAVRNSAPEKVTAGICESPMRTRPLTIL